LVLFVTEKYDKRKVSLSLYGGSKPYPVSATPTHMLRICVNSRFFFCRSKRKRKSYQKENAGMRFRALRSATVAADGSRRLLKKAGENFN